MQWRVLYLLGGALWLAAFGVFLLYAHTHALRAARAAPAHHLPPHHAVDTHKQPKRMELDNGADSGTRSGSRQQQQQQPRRDVQQQPMLRTEELSDFEREQAAGRAVAQRRAGGGQTPLRDFPYTHDELAWRAKIFINMAAYRDRRCHHTIWEALVRASNPERIFFGVYQQHDEELDPDCLSFRSLCGEGQFRADNPYEATLPQVELVCRLTETNVRINRVDFRSAKGPTFGRFMAQEMMSDDADFYLQIDTHSLFVGGWDVEVVVSWQLANDNNALMTTYPRSASLMQAWQKLPPAARDATTPTNGYEVRRVGVVNDTSLYPYDPNLIFFPSTVPVVCDGRFLEDDMGFMPKFQAHHMLRNPHHPLPAPYFAAGFAFMPARMVRVCRYDVHTPMLFDGEEYSYAARLYTHGFNIYAPPTDIVYHFYSAANGPDPKFWQVDWNQRYYIQLHSSRRIRAILSGLPSNQVQLTPDKSGKTDFDDSEFERFGLGKKRSMEEYLRYSNVDWLNRRFTQVCEAIQQGSYPPRGTGIWTSNSTTS